MMLCLSIWDTKIQTLLMFQIQQDIESSIDSHEKKTGLNEVRAHQPIFSINLPVFTARKCWIYGIQQ